MQSSSQLRISSGISMPVRRSDTHSLVFRFSISYTLTLPYLSLPRSHMKSFPLVRLMQCLVFSPRPFLLLKQCSSCQKGCPFPFILAPYLDFLDIQAAPTIFSLVFNFLRVWALSSSRIPTFLKTRSMSLVHGS